MTTLQIPQGQLRGAPLDDGVTAFMGIPYAAPPVGPLRWKSPQPPTAWTGTRDATKAAARCIQHTPYGELEADNPNQSEDCLFLNVWTPDTKAKLPVLFWIHGGEFWAGSGTEARYNGAKRAARGAVIVTINHRLGVFGFLSHPELSAEGERGTSGNYGLLDQIAALKWTRENIAAFGGDPDNITIGGESAGSCSVSFLMASPLSKHLFHKALGESCAYFMPEPHAMKPLTHAGNEQRGIDFMHAAGADSIAELRAMPVEHLLATWMKDMSKRMQPCFDDYVLPHIDQVFAKGEQAKVPLLCGWNGDEYGFIRGAGNKFDLAAFSKRLEASFGSSAAALQDAYGPLSLDTAIDITSDRLMVWPTWKWAEEHARQAPVYAYQFNRAAPGSPFGATHASELEYVFGALDGKPSAAYAPEDRDLSEQVGDYWINFARTGNPNGEALPQWPTYGGDKQVMYLDAKSEAKPLITRERLEMLNWLFSK